MSSSHSANKGVGSGACVTRRCCRSGGSFEAWSLLMIPSCVMVSNGKGGVLKTSLAANLSGLAAVSGWSVLAVDLDPQGNLATDLGCLDRSDGGEALLRAVAENAPLVPLKD